MNLIGRLTRNAEVRNLPKDKKVVNFSITNNDNYRNKQGEQIQQTTYFECSYWISEKVAELLTKGTLVELNGRAYATSWIGKDGEPHAGMNFLTSQIKIHGGGKKNDNSDVKSQEKAEMTKTKSNENDSEKDGDLPF